MEQAEISFTPLLIVIALAFLVPFLLPRTPRIFIPVVVGEIIAGIVVGQSVLGIVSENFVLEVLANFGFVYLLFLSGLEIDFSGALREPASVSDSKFRRVISEPIAAGIVLFVLALTLSMVAALILLRYGLINDPWIMALIFSTTSLGVVMPVLKERGLTESKYGQTIIMASLIADFGTILLISIYVLLRSQGLTLEILLVLVLFVFFIAVYRVVELFQRKLPAERILEELSSATSQLKLRGAMALILVFVALAESLGVENILGAFLAGVIVSFLSRGRGSNLRQQLEAIGYGFFVPIFFIMVGVNFDLPALLNSNSALLLVPILAGVAYVTKFIPVLLYRFVYTWQETVGAGVLLSSRLSLIIAAAAIGLEIGAISEAINSAIILIAIITCTVSPILFNRLVPAAPEEPERVIVVGEGANAALLARRLVRYGYSSTFVRRSPTQYEREEEIRVVELADEAGLEEVLQEAGIDRASSLVAMKDSDEDNIRVCRVARHLHQGANIIAWVQNPALNDHFRNLGVRVINPGYSSVLIVESMVLNPDVFSMIADSDEQREVRKVRLRNHELIGRRVSELVLPGETMVLMIERPEGVLVPGETPGRDVILQADDTVTLVGSGDEVDDAALSFV